MGYSAWGHKELGMTEHTVMQSECPVFLSGNPQIPKGTSEIQCVPIPHKV